MTEQPARTAYCHKIRYGVTRAPDTIGMDGSYAPGIAVSPTLVELVYSAARDNKPTGVSASVTGWFVKDGKRVDPESTVTVHFTDGPEGWPDWLAAEARLHDPEPAAVQPPADRGAVLREAAQHLLARCPHLGKADALRKCTCPAAEELLRLASQEPGADDYTSAREDLLRRLADEAQPECRASLSGHCLREAQSESACDTEAGECLYGGRPADEAQQTAPAAAYGDGKGRVYCLGCASAVAANVPLTAADVDHWELCPSCGRHVIDVARATAEAQPDEHDDELLPAWEAVYEPGNVSDYLIGYANDEAPAKAAAEAWLRSQKDEVGRLEWTPWGTATAMPSGYDHWFELSEHHGDGIPTGPGIVVRRRVDARDDVCDFANADPCPISQCCKRDTAEQEQTVEPATETQPAADGWCGATEIVPDREVQRLAATGLVGYQQDCGRLLHCLHHKPAPASRYVDFQEVTAEDLPDGGICVHPSCGADLLAVQPATGTQQDGVQR